MPLEGFVGYKKEDAERYQRMGWWLGIPLGDLIDSAAELHPEKEALVDSTSRLTYAQLKDKIDRLAIALMALGVDKGERVLVQLPNWGEFVYSLFALQKIGAVAVLLLPRHKELEIVHFLRLTEAKAWILPEKHQKTDYLSLIEDIRPSHPGLEHVILARSAAKRDFKDLERLIEGADLSEANTRALTNRRPDPAEVAVILPTGGTTGLPKAVPRTHNDMICEAKYKAMAREQTADDICLITTPLEHNLGLASLTSTIFTYGKLGLLDSTGLADFCVVVQEERVTCGPLVPTSVVRLVNFKGLDDFDLSSLRALYVGGAKTPAEVIRAFHERIGRKYITAFGMSEGPTCTTRIDDDLEIILNTIGRPCCPHDEFKVIDQEGRALPPEREGELVAKGPGVFAGYFKAPEDNTVCFTRDGFFKTGDLALIDPAGNIRITGRIKDVIIRGGENISPSEIEELVMKHPGVEDVSVIGMPDQELGERICAYIKLMPGAELTFDDVISFLKEQKASVLKLPERIEFIDSIPLTKAGKADKKSLREDIRKRLLG